MTTEVIDLDHRQLLALLGGDSGLRARLADGARFRIETPFRYPGRQGAVVVTIGPRPEPEPGSAAPARPLPEDAVRLADNGGLIKYLSEQGMELEIDMVLSRTVFHAIRQWEGTGIATGQVYLDSTAGRVSDDLWSFLQLVGEIIGLRHVKYKDALIQLERRRDADSNTTGWRPT